MQRQPLAGMMQQRDTLEKDRQRNMTDNIPPLAEEQEQPPAQPPTGPAVPQTQKSKKTVWIMVGIAAIILCLCSIACVVIFGSALYKVNAEKAPAESVLDAYMQHMEDKDAESAYALFSPRAQRQVLLSDVQAGLEENNYTIFEGYQSLSITTIKISAVANVNPDVPQGTVATVTGVVNYEGDIQGAFNATLEKVDDEWMIDGMYVTVPASKFK